MGFSTIVRVGGIAALVLVCLGLDVTYADTLSYFYGYSDPNFGVAQNSDAFGSQNVNLTPEVSAITVQSQNPASSFSSASPSIFAQAASVSLAPSLGYSVMVQSYGYSLPATQQSAYAATSGFAYTANSSASNYYSAAVSSNVAVATPTVYAATTNPEFYSAQVSWLPGSTSATTTTTSTVTTAVVNNSIYTPVVLSGVSSYTPTTTSGGEMSFFGGWGGVQMVVTPRYEATIAQPVVNNTVPNLNVGTQLSLDAPEPATLGFVFAGLGLLALKLRRK